MAGVERNRFEALDALRGVAAFAVLLFHIKPTNSPDLVPHGALAVDFFFVLSGFVIAAAYEDRIRSGMSFTDFMTVRLIRLYPLIFLGLILGAIGYVRLYDKTTLTILIVTGLFLLPTPLGSMTEDQTTIALNTPSWSLLWELVINAAFHAILPFANDRRLKIIIAISFVALSLSAYYCGGLNIGGFWRNALGGAPRVSFSFFVGIFLFRRWQSRRGFGWTLPLPLCAMLLCAIFAVPLLGPVNWAYDVGVVAIVFPLLLILSCDTKTGSLAGTCRVLGAVSYPAYILQSGILPHMRGLPGHAHLQGLSATFASIVLAVGFCIFSWVVLKIYDEPVRAWLLGRRKRDATTPAATAP